MIIGIYKITSPTGKIYIGQSTNIEKRKKYYLNYQCKQQTKIYNSLLKYGFDAHDFDIIEECSESHLDELEIWWKMFYGIQCVENGLNCNYWDYSPLKGKKQSQETKDKISLANKGLKRSEEVKFKMSKASLGISRPKPVGFGSDRIGVKLSEKVRNKISNSKINVKPGENTKFKMSKSALGKKKSEEHKQNMSKAKLNNQYRKGKTHSEFSKSLIGNKNRHPKPDGFSEKISKAKQGKVIEAKYKPITQYDLDNNFIKEWSSIKEAELFFRPNKKIQDNIGKVCRLMSKTAYNFKWKFKEENN